MGAARRPVVRTLARLADWACARRGAREGARGARARALPRVDDALRKAELSYSKVRALTRIATPQNEERLLMTGKSCTAARLETLCRQYRCVSSDREGRPAQTERWVRQRWTDSGMVRIEAQLSPDEAALVMKALEAARASLAGARARAPSDAGGSVEGPGVDAAHDVPAETPLVRRDGVPAGMTPAPAPASRDEHVELYGQRSETPAAPQAAPAWPARADAFVALAESFLAGPPARARSGGERYTVLVHLRSDEHCAWGGGGASLEDGTRVPAETLRRIACDAGLVPVAEGARGETLDVGRRRRSIPPALRWALANRDRGCRFPGCTNRQFVDAHHIRHWMHGGRTALDNVLLLCGAHHRLVHEGGFAVRRAPDGVVTFARPDGRPVAPVPEPAPHAAPPARLPSRQPMPVPDWWVERIDHELVLSAMLAPELGPSATRQA